MCVSESNKTSAVPHSRPYVAIGDEITFPIPAPEAVGPEILVTKNATAGPNRYIYQVPIGYVSHPKQDKRNQSFVSAEVPQGGLGIGTIFLPCEVLREYFYRLPSTVDRVDHPTLYEVLRIPDTLRPPSFAWLSSCVIWS